VLGLVGTAAAAGVLIGIVTQPDRRDMQAETRPMAPAAIVPVEVAEMSPPPAPPVTSQLEVLSPAVVRAAAEAIPLPPPPPPLPALVRRAASAEQAAVAVNAREATVAESPREAPGFDCRGARAMSEQMVCGDARLARLDRRLNRAFERAVESGVPYRELRNEQDDWLGIREDAAHRSPDAVASVYRQRIAELNDLANEPGPYLVQAE
jgi:uncharacterized protein YecT (DUF1311 family)